MRGKKDLGWHNAIRDERQNRVKTGFNISRPEGAVASDADRATCELWR